MKKIEINGRIYYSIIIIIAALMMLGLSTVSAIGFPIVPSYQYQVYSEINIKNSCYFNSTFCPATTTCNITVYNPNNDVIVNNKNMTYGGAYFEYIIPDSGNLSVGFYKCDMICTNGGYSGTESFYIEIITGGNISLFIILAIASILILIFAIAMQNEYLGFISGALFIVTGLYSIIYGVAGLANMYTDAIGYVALGLGIMFLAAAGYSAAAGSGLFSGRDGNFEDSLSDDVWGKP